MEPIPSIEEIAEDLGRKGVNANITQFYGCFHIRAEGRPLKWRLGPANARHDRVTYNDKNGCSHRGDDLPAVITERWQIWYTHGNIHRANNKPAIMMSDGSVEFWSGGVRYNNPFDIEIEAAPACT